MNLSLAVGIWLTLLFSLVSEAAPIGLELGTGLRWEQSSSGNTLDRQGLLGLGVAYSLSDIELLGELSAFSSETVEPSISVQRDHYELMAWGRYKLLRKAVSTVYVSAGLGVFWESVQTRLSGTSSNLSGDPELLLGLSGGYQYAINEKWKVGVRLRAIMNTNNSLSPVADTLIRLVYWL